MKLSLCNRRVVFTLAAAAFPFLAAAQPAPSPQPASASSAQSILQPDMGKLLATGGVSQVEGAGGGGLTPWALIAGYGSRNSYGANAHVTGIRTQDYSLLSEGVAVGIADRLELSLATQEFKGSLAPLDQLSIRQDIFGVKLKVAGDAVYGQDSLLPQIAVGAMVKRNNGVGGVAGVRSVRDLGARNDRGTDYYVSATKILLAQSLLVNATIRWTNANQTGLLGFGGDLGDRRRAMPEVSLAYLVDRHLAVGAEYRKKPRNLGIDNERDWYDAFVAWFPTKNASVTLAWVDLGQITVFNPTTQRGAYLSLQVGF